MALNTWQVIQNRITRLQKLYDRMDNTSKRLYGKFKLRDFNDKFDLDNVISVTSNSASVGVNAIASDLMSATWQVKIEGNITSRQAHDIEQFIDDNFEQADEMLLNKFGMSGLYAFHCNHVCVRGPIGVRWISQVEGGKYKIDCLPVDMRWTPYLFGRNGLKWVAPITFRDKMSLEEEFPIEEYPLANFTTAMFTEVKFTAGNDLEVREYWDEITNEIMVSKNKIFEQKHTLGKPPFVIVFPSAGFMLRDRGYLENEAEDLLFLNRNLYDEENRALSIEQSIGMDILYPPYEYEDQNYDSSPSRKVPKSGETLKVPPGQRHQPVPRGDLNKASIAARQDIMRRIELGLISDAELGSAGLNRPGIWFAKQFEVRHKLEKSRLEALQVMKEGLARMMIEQFINSSEQEGELLIGKTGKKNKYSASMLGDLDKYTISFRFMVSSKEQEIINIAQAQAARGITPLKIIVRDIMKAEDPDGWLRELDLEKAREADPAIALFEWGVRYAEEAEDMEDEADADLKKWQSMMLIDRGITILRQRIAPPLPTQLPKKGGEEKVEEVKPNMQGLMSIPKLLGAGGITGPPRQREAEGVVEE